MVVVSGSRMWTLAGALGVFSDILGVLLSQCHPASSAPKALPEAARLRRRVLWCASLAVLSAGLAMRSVLHF